MVIVYSVRVLSVLSTQHQQDLIVHHLFTRYSRSDSISTPNIKQFITMCACNVPTVPSKDIPRIGDISMIPVKLFLLLKAAPVGLMD